MVGVQIAASAQHLGVDGFAQTFTITTSYVSCMLVRYAQHAPCPCTTSSLQLDMNTHVFAHFFSMSSVRCISGAGPGQVRGISGASLRDSCHVRFGKHHICGSGPLRCIFHVLLDVQFVRGHHELPVSKCTVGARVRFGHWGSFGFRASLWHT